MNDNWKKSLIPELWDGCAAERIIDKLLEIKFENSINIFTTFENAAANRMNNLANALIDRNYKINIIRFNA